MRNDETHIAWQYHNGTKHPGGRLFDPGHVYIPAYEPRHGKRYEGGEVFPLEVDRSSSGLPAMEAIAGQTDFGPGARAPSARSLARLLYFTGGITRRLRVRGLEERIPFRAAACTGALYHIELYIVCGDLEGLEAGVYHFDPEGNALRRLRRGDHRAVLLAASGGAPALAHAPLTLVFTDAYWRNAYKYQAREYRHAFWDSGTMLANALAVAAAETLPVSVVLGFADAEVDGLLGLRGQPEFSLALVALGRAGEPVAETPSSPAPLEAAALPVEGYRVSYPAIEEIQRASSFSAPDHAAAWRGAPPPADRRPTSGALLPLQVPSVGELPQDSIEAAILRRGSSRRFRHAPISFGDLSATLACAVRALPADFLEGGSSGLSQPYLIVHAVDGLAPGAYVYHPGALEFELLAEGNFRGEAAYLGLNQALAGDAAVDIFFLTDLDAVLDRYGNRGYRAAQLDAAASAGRAYLCAYALGFGATGLTFYDDAVTRFFSPHAAGKSVMFLLALGRPG